MSPGEFKYRYRLLPHAAQLKLHDWYLKAYHFKTGKHIYVIQASDGPIKIGVATNPAQRLKTLQTANATELIPLAAWPELRGEERFLHCLWDAFRLRGEWFSPDPALLDVVLYEGGAYCDWTPA